VVGIFPNENSIVRLVSAVLVEQNDDWQLHQIEATAELANPAIEVQPLQVTPKAAWQRLTALNREMMQLPMERRRESWTK